MQRLLLVHDRQRGQNPDPVLSGQLVQRVADERVSPLERLLPQHTLPALTHALQLLQLFARGAAQVGSAAGEAQQRAGDVGRADLLSDHGQASR